MASPANVHAPQAKPHANKADEASPFALLVENAAPRQVDKSAHKNAKPDGDKPADDKTADKQGNKSAQASAPQNTPAKADKADKRDKDEDKTDTAADTNAPDVENVAAADPKIVDPQTPPPVPQAAIIAQPANDDAADGQVEAASASASTPTAPATAQAEDGQADSEIQTAGQAPAQAAPKSEAKTAAPKTDAAKPVKTAAKAAPADSAKPDSAQARPDTDKTGEIKQASQQAAASADAAKPAPQPVQAANDAIPANAVAAPQAPTTPAAPALPQHVQVTAQPSPNLPALAVTIAAKSQSGARQFDIRLDPPELGRVDVRLSIDAAGKTSAHLTADHVHTLDLLQKDSVSLTRALRDAGLDVSQDGLNFSLRQQAHDGGASQGGHRGTSRAFSLSASTSVEAVPGSAATYAPADGRLDIRV